jgi:PAS domain S-box-containing protein
LPVPLAVQSSAQAAAFRIQQLVPTILLALAYCVLAWLAMEFQLQATHASPLWPSAGLALAGVLLWGSRAAPGIFLGALVAHISEHSSGSELSLYNSLAHFMPHPQHVLIGSTVALGKTLEALAAARLIKILHGTADIFASIRGVLVFCSCTLIACLIGSTVNLLSFISADAPGSGLIGLSWLTWWLSEVVGILIVTPFLITWWPLLKTQVNRRSVVFGTAMLVFLFFASQIIFTGWFAIDSLRRAYLIFPILLVITFRFGAPAATIGLLAVSASAAFATLAGTGPLVGSDPMETLMVLEGFLGIASMTVLLLDATNSERRRALAESMQALEQFRTLFKGSPNGLLAISREGLIKLVNARVEEMFGYSRDELIGKPLERLVPIQIRTVQTIRRKELEDLINVGTDRELFGRRKDGSQFPIEILRSPLETSTSTLLLVTIIDITERKHAQERLSAALSQRDELRRHLMQAQEQERLRLSRELHDQTGQMLTAAMLELKGIESLVNTQGRPRLRQLRDQLEQIETTISRIAWELRPASIDELGLGSALAHYVSGWSKQFSIEVDLHCPHDLDNVADEIRTAIYRIAQEALTNVAKHAKDATAVSIIVDQTGLVLRLTIEDNGCGFNTETATARCEFKRGGHGLAGMRERLNLVGGSLEIESTLGLGTTLFARIPVAHERYAT